MECPVDNLKPSVFPCTVGVHVIVWLFSLSPPAELCPMMVSNGTSPPLQVIIWVKVSAKAKVDGKGSTPVNLVGNDESILHGKPPVRKSYNHE